MKVRLVFSAILIGISCGCLYAQSVVITGKKVTYTRMRPLSEYKKTFTINYPKIRAASLALSRKIEKTISYGINLKEEIREVQWLDDADYEVMHNRDGILSIALTRSGSAAYPSGDTRHVVVDLNSGTRVRPVDIFTNLPGLTKVVRAAMIKEIAEAMIAAANDAENADVDVKGLFDEAAKYHPLKLDDYSVAKDGVTFYYDYGFPHVAQALQPAGEFRFTWNQLRPYIRPGSLLARIAR